MLSNKCIFEIQKVVSFAELPKSISYALFPIPGLPFSTWSLVNRVITVSNGSFDHRGQKQWRAVNRYLHKSATPTFIICPQLHQDNDTKKVLDGFIACPVYPVSHTFGDPIEYPQPVRKWFDMKPLSIKWGISPDGVNRKYPVQTLYDEGQEVLAGEGEKQFIWQLCHHVYHDLYSDYKQRKDRLLVIEIASLAMLHLIGRSVNYCGRHFSKIQEYGQEVNLSTLAAFMSIIKTLENLCKPVLEVGVVNEV